MSCYNMPALGGTSLLVCITTTTNNNNNNNNSNNNTNRLHADLGRQVPLEICC